MALQLLLGAGLHGERQQIGAGERVVFDRARQPPDPLRPLIRLHHG